MEENMYLTSQADMKYRCIFLFLILLMVNIHAATISIDKTNIEHNEKVIYDINEKKFQFSDGGSLTLNYNGRSFIYSELKAVDFQENGNAIKKEPQILLDEKGKIKEAYFMTGKEGEYVLGNDVLKLPADSKVIYKEGKAIVQIPKNTIDIPQTLSEKGNSYMFYSNGDNGIYLGEYLIKGGLGYENGNFFIQNQNKIEIAELVISNPAHVKTYIDFNGKINFGYNGAYISMDSNNGVLVIGSNVNKPSPAVMIKKENAYGFRFDSENDHIAFQVSGNSDGSYFKIKKGSTGIVPEYEHLNDFVMNQNGKSFYYNSNLKQLYAYQEGRLIKDFGEATGNTAGSVASTLTGSFKTENGRIDKILGNNVLAIGNNNEFGVGDNKRFVRLRHYPRYPGFYTGISDLEAYNYFLTEGGFERITGIKLIAEDSSGRAYLKDPKNIRYLYDLLFSIPTEQARMVRRMHFENNVWGAAAYAVSDMSVHFEVGRKSPSGNNLHPRIWRHEMGHIVDFRGGNKRKFDRMWYNRGLYNKVYTSGYSHKEAEQISEFIGWFSFLDEDGYGRSTKQLLTTNKNSKYWRAAFAVAWYNHGFTYQRIAEIYSQAGLKYDVDSLYGYIRDVGIRI
ncbi:hypothetical protein J4221_06520 [Candidatus Pacearchaeota archaeon]|nr:hypothetical protein [Candidatus Pacearchaeota archaeon]